jgi:AcrR family transcriptional regulator
MAYRRTDKVARRLAARRDAILNAARAAAVDGGMNAVHIALVADRAGIAAGTVYRYFPAKTDLVAELATVVADQETAAMRRAAEAAPGALSALPAAITTFATRALRARRLTWAMLTEPVEAEIDAVRLIYRQSIARELETRIRAAINDGHLPAQDAALSAAALVGALVEGLIGPLAHSAEDPAKARLAVQTLTLLALRSLGVVDARARGLVVQTRLPAIEDLVTGFSDF